MSKKHSKYGKYSIETSNVMEPVFTKSAGSEAKYGACHETHPPLELGGGLFHGASCTSPLKGYDIYVGLDWGMKRKTPDYPWNPVKEGPLEIYFPIQDGHAPTDHVEFAKMVDWLADRLAEGKKIHAGCIGGHGRTGLLLAALVQRIQKNSEAGAWVRKHYCTSAIETTDQTTFLKKWYGITEVPPAKAGWGGMVSTSVVKAFPKSSNVTRLSPVQGRSLWSALLEAVST